MFEPTYTLNTWYRDVKGLKVGAIVRVAGIAVGEVTKVEFENREATTLPVAEADRERTAIHVEMTIQTQYQGRIRDGSAATISTVGLLGDMYITIAPGDNSHAALDDAATLVQRSIERFNGEIERVLADRKQALEILVCLLDLRAVALSEPEAL